MGVLKGDLLIKATHIDVVYSEDPDVKVPEELTGCGWVDAEKCDVKRGADVVTIRALSPSEWAKYRDTAAAEGRGSALLYVTRTGVLRVNRSKKSSEARAWVDRLSMAVNDGNIPGAAEAHDLLAMRVIGLTRAVPVENTFKAARVLLGYEEAPGDAAPAPESEFGEEGTGTSGDQKSASAE